ncbi:heme ABC transporter permease CcmB [Altererythrobacter sp. BO-6]|uniref:heme exporter protein CcmB n=1 Tax=Altererythrobacter sp. BO-6 TaxID=2604537 RepID=UPI0013E14704|nr:heme exporter protein CcmB [Altererythrobacter sp. BO-6]QIG54880.1 heme ABC transporter permease CcmB [Altererythrobacter sp. BO-6]
MIRVLIALLWRDLRNLLFGGRGGGATLPLLFFLAVAMLYPFAVGPDAPLLARTGGGVLWIAALLAAILPLDRLVQEDIALGIFDQLRMRGVTEEAVMAVRLVAHWLSFGPLLMLACIPASALLKLEGETLRLLLLGLLAGTPGLAAVGLMIAALTAGLRAGAALSGLLLIPLALPILIFGAGALERSDPATLGFSAAISLLLVAITPFAAGAAIRAGREG